MYQLALYHLVVAKVPRHQDGGMHGKLLSVHPCHHHSQGTVIFLLVLLTHIKTCQKTGSTWYNHTVNSTKVLPISPIQLAVHCFLTSHLQYKACRQLGHMEKKQNFPPTFIHIKMSTPKGGICMSPAIGGLA